MIIASQTGHANIYVEETAFPGVKRVAGKVAADLKLVTDVDVKVLEGPVSPADTSESGVRIVAATLGKSAYLEQLSQQGLFDASAIQGKWEVYSFTIIPASNSTDVETLLIAGSDKRGTIYGLFHLSELAGVSPWVWYGDVLPVKKQSILVSDKDQMVSKEPSVRYRGFFINDEWPSFGNWTFDHFGGFTAQMYDHVFELLLRLKGNYLWPAMWTSNFSLDGPGLENARLADEYGVVMSNSHHEPCLRHSEEWDLIKGEDTPYGTEWNFDRNKEGLSNYWRGGLLRNGQFENIITMGMRGERDSEVLGQTATLKDNIDYLKEVITTQNQLIRETINEDLDQTQRMLAIYKEVEKYFHGDETTEGLKTWDGLDGITCMLCEDNFGNLRTLPEEGQRNRKGGWGMYYHFDYHGDPVSYEWINSSHISRTCEQMSQAYDYGIREIWIVNVGDLKPQELPLSYFLDLAYDMEQWGQNRPGAVQQYLKKWVQQQFPSMATQATDIEELLEGYSRINFIRKPEALTCDTYHPTHYGESDALLKKIEVLECKAQKIWDSMADKSSKEAPEKNAFFQLVYFPVMAGMNVQKMQLLTGKNHFLAQLGAVKANLLAKEIETLIEKDEELKKQYHSLNGGKWDKLMSSEHIGFHYWNDEECAFPICMTITPANKPRMIVTAGNESVASQGGDWTRKTLVMTQFLDPKVTESVITLYNGGKENVPFTVASDANWVKVETKGTLELESKIRVSIDRNSLPQDGASFATATITVASELTRTHVDIFVVATTDAAFMNAKNPVPVLPGDIRQKLSRHPFGNGKPIENELGLVLDIADADAITGGSNGTYMVMDGFGKYDKGLKAFPSTQYFEGGEDAPSVSFTFTMQEAGSVEMMLLTAPSNPVDKGNPMAITVSVNGAKPRLQPTVPEGFDGGERSCPAWGIGVLNQIHTTVFTEEVKAGENTLTIRAVDPGVALERVLIREAGTKWADGYLGKVPSWIME